MSFEPVVSDEPVVDDAASAEGDSLEQPLYEELPEL